eukprot:Gb_38838 [translate_table: standard]
MEDQLNEDHITKFKESLSLFDKDGGELLLRLGTEIHSLGLHPTEAKIHGMINVVDVDGNRTIDFPKLLNIMVCKMKDSYLEENLKEAFKYFDKD